MTLTLRLGLLFACGLWSCGDAPVFVGSGTGDGSSVLFHLGAGAYRVEYTAVDREPFFGCNFGLAIETPEGDPLSPARIVVSTEIRTVEPQGQIADRLVTPTLMEGQYALHYLGDRPCDWKVSVSR